MAHLSLALLGAFQATLDGRPLTGFATNKVRALLTYLVVERDRVHSRETLAGLLWGDLPNRAALGNLRYALSNLRQALGDQHETPPFLLITRDTVQFNVHSDYAVDVATLPQPNTVEPQISNFQSLSSTYRGNFLEGFSCDSAPFEEWVLLKREQIGRQVLSALRQLTTFYEARGEYDQAQAYARKQLELESWDEQAHRQLMRALACGGQRGAALAQYEACRRLLNQELGVEPSRETTELYESIRDNQFITEAQTLREKEKTWQSNVPIPLTSFIGRQNEITAISHLLKTTRLLTLTGAGGCGKTRLAIQVATDLANSKDFSDGVWWIDLAALNDPGLVPQTVASTFGLREAPGTPLLDLLLNYLRSKAALLVLDSCEHLIDACAFVTQALLTACPCLQIMVTSRQPLGIDGEVVWRVPSLTLPGSNVPLELLQQYDAVRLFRARAATVISDWKFAANAQAIAAICMRLDGIPLAIELAAARLKILSSEQIAARLDDRFELLTGGSRTALPRHQTLRATMDWSYDLLSEAEREMLRRLSVFVGGFSLEAVESVWSDQLIAKYDVGTINRIRSTEHGSYSAIDLLASLIDKSLVVAERRGNATRYHLLETIREYAYEKSGDRGETCILRDRHSQFFLRLAEEAALHLGAAQRSAWFERLEEEHDNLKAALRWAEEKADLEVGLRLATALFDFWQTRCYWSEGQEQLARLLALPGAAAKTRWRARALNAMARLAQERGNLAFPRSLLEEGLAIGKELADKQLIGESFAALGLLTYIEGDEAAAREFYREALALARELGSKLGIAYALDMLGNIARNQGDYVQARSNYEESLATSRDSGDKEQIPYTHNNLGALALRIGDFALARSHVAESLAIWREVGDKRGVSAALGLLGTAALMQGDNGSARRLLEESLALQREIGANPSPALRNLGYVTSAEGDLASARALVEESLRLSGESANTRERRLSLLALGDIARLEDEWDQAATLFEQTLALARTAVDKTDTANALRGLGRAAIQQRNLTRASALQLESILLFRELKDKFGIASCLAQCAVLFAVEEETEQAVRLFAASSALLETIGAVLPPADGADCDDTMPKLRAQLGDATFDQLWQEGRAMALEQSTEYALVSLNSEKLTFSKKTGFLDERK